MVYKNSSGFAICMVFGSFISTLLFSRPY